MIPTVIPTEVPTLIPTMLPSTSPTTQPTKAPTPSPTRHPTTTPTTMPSTKPTTGPSTSPTTSPTTSPSSAPTEMPTLTPTREPTFSPTFLNEDWISTAVNITFYLGGITYTEFQTIEGPFFYENLPRVLNIRPVHVRDYHYLESSAKLIDVLVELMMSDVTHAQLVSEAVRLPGFDLAMNEEIVASYDNITSPFYVIGNFEAELPQTTAPPAESSEDYWYEESALMIILPGLALLVFLTITVAYLYHKKEMQGEK